MNSETQILAAKLLAQILSGEENQPQNNSNASEILARLDEMNARLTQIESKVSVKSNSQTNSTHFLKPSFPVFLHSSQEQFAVEETERENEKACRFEPGGKPCDNCAMCSSRGF